MQRFALLFLSAALAFSQQPESQDAVFRSDVSLVRVDVQVLDRDHRAIVGLKPDDFVLRESGNPQQIRNFQAENMPVDVLLLFDVSASMRPHVERIVSAAHQALRVLGHDDRVGIMVFDRNTRVRLAYRQNLDEVERELDRLVHSERFNGGTDITRAMLDAASFVGREGRATARRAIVIVTDDATEMERNDEGVGRALTRADAVLSLLLAPNAMPNRQYPSRGGGGYPGRSRRGGIGMGGGGLGGIWGPSIPQGSGRYPGSGQGGGPGQGRGGPHTQSAGTAEIARASGGDNFSIDEGSALETTLNRLRQRYALHFNSEEAAKSGQRLSIDVQLSQAAQRRYPDAELRFRRIYLGNGTPAGDPVTVTKSSGRTSQPETRSRPNDEEPLPTHRRPAVSEAGGPAGPILQPEPPPL